MEWLAFQPTFQLATAKIFMLPPGLASLYPQWISNVEQFSPVFKNKNLSAFGSYFATNGAIMDAAFTYASDQAYTLLDTSCQKIYQKALSVQEGFTQATAQVDVFEQTQAKGAGISGSKSS